MGKVLARSAAVLALCTGPTFVGVPTATATSRTIRVPGVYRVHVTYDNGFITRFRLTLRANGTGTTGGIDLITWTRNGTTITITDVVTGHSADFTGTINATGFSTRHKPGTVTTSDGVDGRWYAIRKT